MSDRNSGEVMLAFVLGGIIGAAVGILYAPRSGKDTRKKLKDISEDLSEKIGDVGEEVKSKSKQIIAEGKEKIISSKDRIEEAIEAGRKVFEKK